MLLHIPSEAATFGVKFWVLAERNTGHVAHLEWYIGKKSTLPFNRLQGPKAFLQLLKTAIYFIKVTILSVIIISAVSTLQENCL